MASHYENYGTGQTQSQQQQQQQKPFIDFYRQSNQANQANYQSSQQQQQMTQQQQQQQHQQQQQFMMQQQQQQQQQQQYQQQQMQQLQYSGNQGNSQALSMGLNLGSNQSSQNQYPLTTNLHNNSGGINVYQSQPQARDRQSYEGGAGSRSGTGMLITSNEMIDYQQQLMVMDPSPINASIGQAQRFRSPNAHPLGSTGFIQGSSDNFIDSNFNTIDTKRDLKQIQVDRNVALKRRSIENKEAIMGNKQRNLFGSSGEANTQQTRQLMNGAKSALANYGTQGVSQSSQSATGNQAIKQINKNAKVERDPVMDLNQQQFQNKRSLAKSQSQNRLVLLSQEALNKNNPYQDQADEKDNQAVDKNSFFKDQVRGGSNQPTDLLYKQHMQYSGAHIQNQKNWLLKANSNNHILSRMTTKSECTFCNKTLAGGMISQSCIPHHCSSIYCSKDQQGMMIQNHLSKKYSTNRDYYNLKIVNDLIYNENTHIVSIFKDYLILDDINEFLKRSYTQQETKVRLPKLCSFYEKYSQVFPNYVVLPESKYMFKNIQRKQKLIDEQYQLQEEIAKKQHQTLLDEDKLFNTKFYNSYYSNMGGPSDLNMSRQQYEHQAKAIAEQVGKQPAKKRIDQMKIDELVDRFLMKDSESNIQLFTSVALDFSEFQNSFVNHTQMSQSKISILEKTNTKQTQQKVPSNQAQQSKVQVMAQTTQQQQQQQKTQQQQQQQQKTNPTPQIQISQGKRSLDAQSKRVQPQNQLTTQVTGGSTQGGVKKQKTSFNNQQQQQTLQHKGSTGNLQVPRLDQHKASVSGGTGEGSNKTTPRLQKGQVHTNIVVNQQQEQNKPIIQTSPATKEALSNYLQDCNIDSEEYNVKSNSKVVNIDPHFQTQKLGMGSLLSPTSTHLGSNMLESPHMKSPNFIGPKNPLLHHTGSQSSLLSSQQQFAQNSLSHQSRQNMKSQLVMPTISSSQQQITSMKKSTRLSNGGTALQKTHNTNQQRKNASPMPSQQQVSQQNQNQCVVQSSSRNQMIVNNSTQKSVKSHHHGTGVTAGNTHTKYLSGGNEQYQKLLVNINQNNPLAMSQQQQQNSYLTNYDTINSNLINSSNKKSTGLLHQQKSKQELHSDAQLALSHGSNHKQQQIQSIRPPEINDNIDNEAITGEDCDDFGIADERFASPDANKIIFQTLDDNIQGLLSHGRQSLDGVGISSTIGGTQQFSNQNQQQYQNNMMLLSNTDDKILANSNNYDQIKKHLEQLITVNNTNTNNNNNMMVSLPSQHTFDMNTLQSNSKRYNMHVKSSDKYSAHNDDLVGKQQTISSFQPHSTTTAPNVNYTRDNNGMTQSATSNNNNQSSAQQQQDQSSNSRNGTQKKQFESLKQKIRGQFGSNGDQQVTDTQTVHSANKTPNKSSTHSKKSTNHMMGSTQQMILQQNRMSLDANQVPMMMPTSNTHQGGVPMTSTSANGRQLSFSQTSFSQNAQNYRSITNLQQRKASNNTHHTNKDMSIESKRLSGQNRQSFKDHQTAQQSTTSTANVQTALKEGNKVIKRSATGKMLHIQDTNSQSQNFGQQQIMQNSILNSLGSTQSFQNPNFMSNSQQIVNSKLYATTAGGSNQHISHTAQIQNLHHQQQLQQQQQAAGTVRVMTPSYSLASLSKLITPTTTTSPITATVTLGNTQQAIARKQTTQKSVGKSSAMGVHSHSNTNQHLHHNPSSMSNNSLANSHSQNFLLADKNAKLVTSSIHQNSQKSIVSSKTGMKSALGTRQNNTLQASSHPVHISTTINQKLGRQHQLHPSNHHQLQNHSLNQQPIVQTFQATPRGGVGGAVQQQQLQGTQNSNSNSNSNQDSNNLNQQHIQINPSQISVQARRVQPLNNQHQQYATLDNNSNMSGGTISLNDNNNSNSSKQKYPQKFNLKPIDVVKSIEQNKHPKFMKTIEEYSNHGSGGANQQQHTSGYNTMLSSTIGGHHNKATAGHALTNSLSQAQLEVRNQKNKIQTVVNSNQASIKRQTLGGGTTTLSQSGSVSHFKSPSQQINTKKQLQGRYLNM